MTTVLTASLQHTVTCVILSEVAQCSLHALPLFRLPVSGDLRCVAAVLHRLWLLPVHCSIVPVSAMVRLCIEALRHLVGHRPCAGLLVRLHRDMLVRLGIRARVIRSGLHGRII